MAVTLRGDRGAFGAVLTPAQTSPLRLGTLAARATSAPLLSVDANGDVKAGALAAADLPSVFTRRDVAETINESWTWATGKMILFSAGSPSPPAATSRSIGTRIVTYPAAASTEYALGIENSFQWFSVPLNSGFKWYQGATERLRLDLDGTLNVVNGSGYAYLAAAGSLSGTVLAGGSLLLAAGGTGVIQFQSAGGTGAGQILPTVGYRENLGAINRKYLSLHAAELWVETLVAQQTLATIGGRIVVGPTTTLTRDLAPGAAFIYVKHNAFELEVDASEHGSKLVLQASGKFETMWVINPTVPAAEPQGDYKYQVHRDVTTSGVVGGVGSQWYAGDAILDTGKIMTGGSFIDLYSVKGLNPGTSAGPTIVGNVRVGHWGVEWQERWAVGNLKGIFGNTTTKVGAAFGAKTGPYLQVDATDGIRMVQAGLGVTGQWAMNGDVAFGYPSAGQLTFTAADGVLRLKWLGVDKMVLAGDGSMRLATDLIAGAWGAKCAVRSANASAFNVGHGFYLSADATTATALIGHSLGRRIQWDGASLLIASDGLTINENGITLQQQASGSYSPTRAVQWSGGAYMWDSSVNGQFAIERASGSIWLYAGNGSVMMQGGGSGIDRATLQATATYVELGGTLVGGGKPGFRPLNDALHDLGLASRRWNNIHGVNVLAASFQGNVGGSYLKTTYGAFAGAVPNAYYLEVGYDSAGKPVSGTWIISPSNREAKDDIVPVDPAAALALVRRVPLVRFRYNGALGSPAGVPAIGVIAEDMAAILPDSVQPDLLGQRLGWNPHELLILNVAAVQALATRLDALDERTRRDS